MEKALKESKDKFGERVIYKMKGLKFVETRLSCGLWADPEKHIQSESILIALFQKYGFSFARKEKIELSRRTVMMETFPKPKFGNK